MISTETIINRINEEIEKLKQKDILVKVKMPVSEENKFSTYSTHELNSVSYQVIYCLLYTSDAADDLLLV